MSLWLSLPVELKLSVVDFLQVRDLKSLSVINRQSRFLVLPFLFKSVKLDGHDCVIAFLGQVPAQHLIHIRRLEVSFRPNAAHSCPVAQTDYMIALLNHCNLVQELILYLFGSPEKHIIPCFTRLVNLTSLLIGNIAPESVMPLSERSVVSMAASVPQLRHLALHGISRSMVHAPELLSVYPYVPLVIGDEDIEDHPVLGSALCLPSLLWIPTLRELQLLDTHLGDRLWSSTLPSCSLEALDLGTCCYETPEFNRICMERILRNVASHCPIKSLHVSTPLQDELFSHPNTTPLRNLQHVHLMPLLPTNQVAQTLLTLSGSPVEIISIECYEEDAADMCHSLEEFLIMRLRSDTFFRVLKEINLQFAALDPSKPMTDYHEALGRVNMLCKDAQLRGSMPDDNVVGDARVLEGPSDRRWS